MLIVGLLGGIASGKSTVAALLAEHGAAVLDADRAAHDALRDPEVVRALRSRFGETLFGASGELDRRALAGRVFGGDARCVADREFLEGLIHPRVRADLRSRLAELKSTGQSAAVLDIPLLLEAGWANECDVLLFVDSPLADRLARAKRRGWDAAELASRESAQLPIKEKQRRAHAVIPNAAGADELRARVAAAWQTHILPRLP
ncbi:MAG: dephospho-CoA kinase [Planctomycetota bacterium]